VTSAAHAEEVTLPQPKCIAAQGSMVHCATDAWVAAWALALALVSCGSRAVLSRVDRSAIRGGACADPLLPVLVRQIPRLAGDSVEVRVTRWAHGADQGRACEAGAEYDDRKPLSADAGLQVTDLILYVVHAGQGNRPPNCFSGHAQPGATRQRLRSGVAAGSWRRRALHRRR
jgi:hypothetical protein